MLFWNVCIINMKIIISNNGKNSNFNKFDSFITGLVIWYVRLETLIQKLNLLFEFMWVFVFIWSIETDGTYSYNWIIVVLICCDIACPNVLTCNETTTHSDRTTLFLSLSLNFFQHIKSLIFYAKNRKQMRMFCVRYNILYSIQQLPLLTNSKEILMNAYNYHKLS